MSTEFRVRGSADFDVDGSPDDRDLVREFGHFRDEASVVDHAAGLSEPEALRFTSGYLDYRTRDTASAVDALSDRDPDAAAQFRAVLGAAVHRGSTDFLASSKSSGSDLSGVSVYTPEFRAAVSALDDALASGHHGDFTLDMRTEGERAAAAGLISDAAALRNADIPEVAALNESVLFGTLQSVPDYPEWRSLDPDEYVRFAREVRDFAAASGYELSDDQEDLVSRVERVPALALQAVEESRGDGSLARIEDDLAAGDDGYRVDPEEEPEELHDVVASSLQAALSSSLVSDLTLQVMEPLCLHRLSGSGSPEAYGEDSLGPVDLYVAAEPVRSAAEMAEYLRRVETYVVSLDSTPCYRSNELGVLSMEVEMARGRSTGSSTQGSRIRS